MENSTIFAVSHLVSQMVVLFFKGPWVKWLKKMDLTISYFNNITVTRKDQEEHDTNVQR